MGEKKCVLCYHRILDMDDDYNMINVSPRNFEEQMKYIKNHYRITSLDRETVWEGCGGEDETSIAISFDDGYADFMNDALSVIKKYDIPVTVFLSTEKIGSDDENWMDEIIRIILKTKLLKNFFELRDEEISGYWIIENYAQRVQFYYAFNQICRNVNKKRRNKYIDILKKWAEDFPERRSTRRILSVPELRVLKESRLFSFGAHTESHPSLAALSPKEQYMEINRSKEFLEDVLDESINLFAYPFGSDVDYSEETIEILKECGFKKAFTTECKCYTADNNAYRIPRCVVPNFRGPDFERWISNIINDTIYDNNEPIVLEEDDNRPWITYVGCMHYDRVLWQGDEQICIWGMGTSGKEIYKYIASLCQLSRVVYWGDKKTVDFEKNHLGIPVADYKKIGEYQKNNNMIVLTKGRYAWEISRELRMHGIHNIRIYI